MAKLKYGFSSLVSILRFTGTRYYSGGAAGDLLPSLTVNREGNIDAGEFVKELSRNGIKHDDPLLTSTITALQTNTNSAGFISEREFTNIIQERKELIGKAIKGDLVVPNFETFSKSVDEIYHDCSKINEGKNASYIPELARVDPTLWGVSFCTVDGQRYSVGNSDSLFTIQSGGKCFNYAIGLDEIGTDKVHEYVGMEPSGSHFNRITLNNKDKPHNPMINSGALVLCSLIKPRLSLHERMNFMLNKFDELSGLPHRSIKCDMITCDSEMDNCDKNMALIYYMKSKNSLPPNTSVDDTIKFYTRLCSIELNCDTGAVMAATLASGGICPLTEKRVISSESVRHVLTLMHSCGMYDFSGEFAFNVGLPAKSGVSGVIIVVVPGIMGLCLYSPRLNTNGNSIKGLEFCRLLTTTFGFHIYNKF